MVIMTTLGIPIDHNIPGDDIPVRHFVKQETGIDDASTGSIHGNQGSLNKRVVMEAQLGEQAMNLEADIQGRKFGYGLQQRGEAEPVEKEGVYPEVVIEKEGVIRCGSARELTEELIGETSVWIWNVAKEGESVVES